MHNGCILCGGVGVGKTHTAVQYYLNNEAPKPVYVITTAKKRDKGDWQDVWAEVGMHKNPELTMGAVVIVDSWENVKKYEEVTDAFFIFDEQRLVGTGAWVKAFYKIAASNRWIMLSATPGDNWLDYVPVFRANGFIKNITQFKEDHVVSRWTGRYYQVIGYRQVPKLVRWRNQLLVDMPYDKHTTRHSHIVDVRYDKDLVQELVTKRWHVYENRPLTDASELFRVMRKVVYSDPSRLDAIRKMLQVHPKLIVFYNFDYELELLRTLATTGITTSESEKSLDSTSKSSSSSDLKVKDSATATQEDLSQTVKDRWGNTHSLTRTSTGAEDPKTDRVSEPSTASPQMSTGSQRRGHSTKVAANATNDSWKDDQWRMSQIETSRQSNGTSTQTYLSTPGTTSGSTTHHTAQSQKENDEWEQIYQPRIGLQSNGTESPTSSLTDRQSPRTTSRLSSMRDGQMSGDGPSEMSLTPSSTEPSETLLNEDSRMETSTMQQTSDGALEGQSDARSLRTDLSTTNENGIEDNSNDSLSNASLTKDSSQMETGISTRPPSQPKESNEWTTDRSPQEQSRTSMSSERHARTLRTRDASSKLESLRTNSTIGRSSRSSSQSQGHSSTGKSSTPLPPFQVAEWNGHKHEAIPTTTSWVYLVQYVAGAEAWETVETDAICFWSMPYSYKLWWQSHGRIDRLNTSFLDLHYYILFGDSILERAVKKSLALKKSFNESGFAKKTGIWQN